MSNKRYPEEFKVEAVKQVTERGHSATDVAKRLGVSQPTLYDWIKRYSLPETQRVEQLGQSAEIRRLKAELKRVMELHNRCNDSIRRILACTASGVPADVCKQGVM